MNSIPPHMLGLSDRIVVMPKDTAEGLPRTAAPARLLRVAIRWRRVLAGTVAGGAALGCLVTLLTTRQYASTVELQIARETAQVVNIGAMAHDVSIGDQEFYQTEYGLLRTRALAERVARDIGAPDDPAFFRMFGKQTAFAENPGAAGSDRRREIVGEILLDHVVVAPVHGSSLVDIEVRTPSPALSEKIAQFWGQDFIASNLDRRQEASGYARRFLEIHLAELRDRLEISERRAVEYAAGQGMIDLTLPGGSQQSGSGDPAQARLLATDDLLAMNAAREAATNERIQAASRLAAAGDQPDASSDALAYRALGLMRKERADIAAEHAATTAQGGPDTAAAKGLHAKRDALDSAIQDEGRHVRGALEQAYKAALAREHALSQQVDALKETLAEQRRRAIQYAIYRREADSNRALYEALLQRSKEIGVAGAAENNNVAIVGAARVPDRPAAPNFLVNLLLFSVAGALAGALAAVLLERIDRGVADAAEFTEKLGLPLLGVVPRLKMQDPIVSGLADMPFGFAEAHLAIAAGLALSRVGQGEAASLAVIGTGPHEGATATAIALARIFARGRRKVVLIDANVRAPSLHLAFGLENGAGLVELLSGSAAIDDVIRATGQDGLSVVTAGDAPDLLAGRGLAPLLMALQRSCDLVIVECPPLTCHAEAPLIAAATSGVVYVVAANAAPAVTIRMAIARLGETRIFGGVLTMPHQEGRVLF